MNVIPGKPHWVMKGEYSGQVVHPTNSVTPDPSKNYRDMDNGGKIVKGNGSNNWWQVQEYATIWFNGRFLIPLDNPPDDVEDPFYNNIPHPGKVFH